MKKILNSKWILVILPLMVLIISLGVVISLQGLFFFKPNKDVASYEELKNDSNYEEVDITTSKGKHINGWLKKNKSSEVSPTVIFFMGNYENASTAMKVLKNTGRINYFEGLNLVMMDYPGYGKSDGFVNNDDTFLNYGTEVYDWVAKQDFVDKNNILVLGFSIGTGVATYVASVRDVNGLVLIAPYDEALSLYNDYVNVFHGPVQALAKFRLKSYEYAQNVKVPVLIFTSKADEAISYEFSQKLSPNFNEVDEFILFEDVKHSGYYNKYEVWDRIQNYLYNRMYSE